MPSAQPLGSERTQFADVRIIAATNQDLDRLVREGKFRADLLYRLQVIRIVAPPLRERREDIVLMARATLDRHAPDHAGFTRRAEAAMVEHPWPGNVRQLQNAVERGVAYAPRARRSISSTSG